MLCQTQDFMRGSGDLSLLHLMVSYKCWEGVSSLWLWFVCVYECLAGRSGAWGSAMPPTVVYLGLVHAPLGGVDPRGAVPQHSSISGCANLATMLWHSRFSSGPAFSLLSSLNPTPGLPRWDRGERGSLVQFWETTTAMSLKRPELRKLQQKPGIVCFQEY